MRSERKGDMRKKLLAVVRPCFDCHNNDTLTYAVDAYNGRGQWTGTTPHVKSKAEALKIAKKLRSRG